ncbi:MAG: HAD hydrolase-like protein [Eubacterium sp.]
MKKYQYIFWDLDGTMINTYEGIANCIRYALEPYGITVEDGPEMNKLIGPSASPDFSGDFWYDGGAGRGGGVEIPGALYPCRSV